MGSAVDDVSPAPVVAWAWSAGFCDDSLDLEGWDRSWDSEGWDRSVDLEGWACSVDLEG